MRPDWPIVEEDGSLSVSRTSRREEYEARRRPWMEGLLDFLNQLDRRGIHYDLGHHRDDSVMVKAQVPGAYWEVEFFADGHTEVEVFRSEGSVEGRERLASLLAEEDAWEQKPPASLTPR
jgi:hypothetical protein